MCRQQRFLQRIGRVLGRVAGATRGHPQMLVMPMNERSERVRLPGDVRGQQLDVGPLTEQAPSAAVRTYCPHATAPIRKRLPPVLPHCERA